LALGQSSGLLLRLLAPVSGRDWTPTPCERDSTTAVTLAVTPGHRQCDLVSTLARSIVTETNVSPVFFDQIQTQVDLDASSAALSRAAGH
jgi:hypothetical protein